MQSNRYSAPGTKTHCLYKFIFTEKKCFKYIQKYTRYDFGDSLSVNDAIQKFIFSFFLIKSKYQSSETETTWGSLFRLRILKIIVWSLSDHCLLQQMSVEWILREMNFDELMTQNKCS